MAAQKVPVIYQQKRKIVNVDFSSYEAVTIGIRHRLQIIDDVKLFGKRNEEEEFFDIEDDEDLEALEGAAAPVLLVKTNSQTNMTPQQPTGQVFLTKDMPMGCGVDDYDRFTHHHVSPPGGLNRGPGPALPASPVHEEPPDYEESIRATGAGGASLQPTAAPRQQERTTTRPKTTVIFGQKTKQMVVDRSDFEAVRNTITKRCNISEDFQLKVKDDSGEMIDIDNDDDLEDNEELMHTIWVILTKDMKVVRPDVDAMAVVKMAGDTENYSVTEIPRQESRLVVQVYANLTKDVCIPSISAKLDEVEQCLRIAYYSTIDNKTMHVKAQDMQFDVQKICAQCDTTMLRIKLKCGDLLNELQCGFGYLLEGFEDFGIERLSAAGPIAAEIQKAATELTTLLEKSPQSVADGRSVLAGLDTAETMKRKVEAEKNVRAGVVKKKSDAVHQSHATMQRLQDRENSALEASNENLKSCSGFGFGLKKVLTFGLYKGDMPRAQQKERLANDMRLEQARERERLEQLKAEELKARIEFERFVASMESEPKQMSETAIQGAEQGLKTLNSFLQSLSDFWEKNKAEFESISNTVFISQLKNIEDEEKRKVFWQTKSFKTEALRYIARFVAIQTMCDEFHETMTKVLDDIHRCIRDNPTSAEAREELPRLVREFKERGEQLKLKEKEEEEEEDFCYFEEAEEIYG